MGGDVTGVDVISLDTNTFRETIGHFASGVTVITTRHGDVDFGTTASAMTSLSVDPPMLIVCLNRTSTTGDAVTRAGVLAVNILTVDQVDLAARFATKDDDKFRDVDTGSVEGLPLLTGALASITCRVRETVHAGTHSVFICDALRAVANDGSPLAYFRGAYGRLAFDQDEFLRNDIRERLATGDLSSSFGLVMAELAKEYDVPRSTVYHALVELEREGLLRRGSTGKFVAARRPSS